MIFCDSHYILVFDFAVAVPKGDCHKKKMMNMGRKPIGQKAMSAKDRKQEQRARQWKRINTVPDQEWTDAECLLVLSTTRYGHGSPMDRAAWEQLGRLRGFDSDVSKKKRGSHLAQADSV